PPHATRPPMSPFPVARRWAAPLVVGVALGAVAVLALRSEGQPPPAFKKEDPPYRGLDANLYVQTAAEYRACCYQAYSLAAARLEQRVKERAGAGKPPAVILDLDETVLDNGGFQSMQLRHGLAYDQRLWDVWEEKHADAVGLVPGAKDFLAKATALGVAAVYLSNRNEKCRAQTKAIPTPHDIAVRGAQ